MSRAETLLNATTNGNNTRISPKPQGTPYSLVLLMPGWCAGEPEHLPCTAFRDNVSATA